jgi:excinuclease UvrABC helicase subunit UvrB
VAEKSGAYKRLDFSNPRDVKAEIEKLEALMYEQAKNLAFEAAAATRDRIAELNEQLLR